MTTALVIAIVFLQAVDGWTTYQALKRGSYERNAWIAALIARLGKYPALLLAKGWVVALVIGFQWLGWWEGAWGLIGLFVLAVVYALVVINNFKVLREGR